jgi:hypothetical protein
MSDSPSGPANLPPVRPQQNPYGEQPGMNPYATPTGYPQPYPYPPPQDDHAMRWVIPVGTSGWAIASGYCGLLSLAVCFLGPVAIFCGVMAIRETNADPNLGGLGRAIFGIVTGLIGTVGLGLMIYVLIANPR